MDLSKLSDDQLDIALKIADEAKRQGINPDFVLPMVMIESGFNQKAVSKKGAIGVMQLMPDTAKSLNVDPHDLDQNIAGGLSFIKQLMQNKNIGNDPYKVLTGYNAGPNTKFFETGNLKDLPDETLDHMLKVTDLYGKSLPSAQVEEASGEVPSLPKEGKPLVSADSKRADDVRKAELSVPVAAGAGAILGAGAGTTAATMKAKIDAATEAYEAIKNKLSAAPSFEGDTPGGKWGAKTGFGIGEGTVEEASSAYKRAKPQGEISGRSAKLYGVRRPGESADLVQRLIDRAKAKEALEAAELAAKPTSRISPALSYAGRLMAIPLKGAMYGAGTAASMADVYNRLANKDVAGATISGLGGTAAGLAPFVSSMGALPAMAVAAPLYLTASDRLEYLKKHPEDIRLEESYVDPLGGVIRGNLP